MPGARAEIVLVVPVPVVVVPPGFLVSVHVPVAGRPVKATLPVGIEQVGWVVAPITGVAGTVGAALITTFAEGIEVHPAAFVTVKV